MRFDVEGLIRRYRRIGLLLDTNLLLVLVVGHYQPKMVEQFKRTSQYTADDYQLLAKTVSQFSRLITTPHILTEVNSLSNQLTQATKKTYAPVFADQIKAMSEIYIASEALSTDAEFSELGLTDISIMRAANDGYLVLTDDLRLTVRLNIRRIDVINFNHLRSD
jgi:hypothetical protein